MSFLLDTCFISEFVKPVPDRGVCAWLQKNSPIELFISVISLGEIQQGLSQMPSSKRKTKLLRWIDQDLRSQFHERLISVDEKVALAWGKLRGELRSNGRVLPVIDALIAATALVHHLTVVTHNVRDFEATGISVLNPWQRH